MLGSTPVFGFDNFQIMIPSVIALVTCPQLCRLSWVFFACCRLSCLTSALMPVVDFHVRPQLCRLFWALKPFVNFLACPQLCRLFSALCLSSALTIFALPGPQARPSHGIDVSVCLSVCLFVCPPPPPEAWTFRSKTDSKADNRRQSPGQATKLWTCQGQSMKAENR